MVCWIYSTQGPTLVVRRCGVMANTSGFGPEVKSSILFSDIRPVWCNGNAGGSEPLNPSSILGAGNIMSEAKEFVQFLEKGRTEDLPREIQDDIKKSIRAYFSGDANIQDGWDMDRGVKVLLEESSDQVIFCKMVTGSDGKARVAVMKFPKDKVDEWLKE